MARVTVEDCVVKIPNRFELVMKAAQRARNISSGAEVTVERDNDKNPVVALREIADETVSLEELEEQLVKGLQHFIESDEPEEEEMMDTDAIQRELATEVGPAGVHEEVMEDMLTVETEAQEFSMTIGANQDNEAETAMELGDSGTVLTDSQVEVVASDEGTYINEGVDETKAEPQAAPVDESPFAGAVFEDVTPAEAEPEGEKADESESGDTPEGA